MKAPKKKAPGRDEDQANTTTAIYLPKRQLALLQAVAFARMKQRTKEKERGVLEGNVGKPSVSAVISGLIEAHEKELTKEGSPFLPMFED